MIARLTGIAALAAALSLGCDNAATPTPDLPYPERLAETTTCLAAAITHPGPDVPTLPARWSETGCSYTGSGSSPAPGALPFVVNSPLWTDGVIKERWLVLPPSTAIGFTPRGTWRWPDGALIIKHFILEEEAGDADSRRPIESRLMLYRHDTWHYFSYRWMPDGDAILDDEPETVPLTVRRGGIATTVSYDYPSEDACKACHSTVTGEALGPRTRQLDRPVQFVGTTRNQLDVLAELGAFDGPLPSERPAPLVDPADKNAPLTARARSFLHANCAHCHQPEGWNSSEIDLDLRYDVPLDEMLACDARVHNGVFRHLGDVILTPGDPAGSAIYGRMVADGAARMPPIGRSAADPIGIRLVHDWIAAMSTCSDP